MVMNNENRTYLGDGVYARRGMSDYAGIVIETSNGISVTNAIYLEPEVAGALVVYLTKPRETGETDECI